MRDIEKKLGGNPVLFSPVKGLSELLTPALLDVYDGIEVCGLREVFDAGGNFVDYDHIPDDPDLFSVYLHYKHGNRTGNVGRVCIGDFGTLLKARIFARAVQAYVRRHAAAITIFL